MKNKMRLTLLFFCISACAFAQDDNGRRGYIGASFGVSLPVGNFADNVFENDKAGMGKNGYQYSIVDAGIKFIPNFGVSVAIKGAVIPFDAQALADGYAEEYGGQFKVVSTRWGYTGLFVGPFVSIPTKYIEVDFKFMLGLLVAQSPEITTYQNDEKVAFQGKGIGSSIGFNVGPGIRVHVSQRISLLLNGEYHISLPRFQIEDEYGNLKEEVYSQQITTFGFTGGIALRIFKSN